MNKLHRFAAALVLGMSVTRPGQWMLGPAERAANVARMPQPLELDPRNDLQI